jgi:hypothetical protein
MKIVEMGEKMLNNFALFRHATPPNFTKSNQTINNNVKQNRYYYYVDNMVKYIMIMIQS